ncbi:hypothetical protein R69658_07948 [Paraburkholderia aspalathi]|uniref:TIGR02391 family protein n=1 Tax=Paraburkholderia aspalathi TaxID=1324617 RepID=A0ABN7NHC1_9BURK|nr:hypothetical protein [Paraburkholderia aspalathi]MBK3824196.1 hypothetical protein [Paraburkholderia aspalathi]MBK3836036.1 hypothetical protein [Paraburkholderia aspalathi]MBK3865806.1 hypothetical protein [Paraburkholderia aspalathi]CAE6867489.1 hypothetical protein R69658_07948 [Paraburkholderia aspalathi]
MGKIGMKFMDPDAFSIRLPRSLLSIPALGKLTVDTGRVTAEALAMSRYGWYVDLKMGVSKSGKFKAHVDGEREADAEALMVEHFGRRADSIRSELIAAYPARRAIFDAAFDAHANGQYLLSIPVFFAQVDGICTDVLRLVFFQRTGREKVIADLKGRAGSELAQAYLAPLDTDMPATMSLSSRGRGVSGLNRHTVLHGESVDYGTRENSLRAISLLNYISQSLRRELPEIEQGAATTDAPPADSAAS